MNKNIAIILAGGSGQRMGQDIPKQFLNVENKPVIIYTLEAFQRHPNIDAIIVVCIEGWHDILKAYAKQFGIDKLVAVVNGGVNGQDSIKRGLLKAKELFSGGDNVIIHDGIRPMISEEIISDNIAKCNLYGNAITVIPCAEAMLLSTEDGLGAEEEIARNTLKRTQTPQAFRLSEILSAHEEAKEKGITNSIASCTLYTSLGRKVYYSTGSEKNVKLTTPEDIDIFKALLHTRKEEWMK